MSDLRISGGGNSAPALAADVIPIGRGDLVKRTLTVADLVAAGDRRNFYINAGCQIQQRANKVVAANARNYGGADRISVVTAGFTTVGFTITRALVGPPFLSGYAQSAGGLVTTGAGTMGFASALPALYARSLNGYAATFSATILQVTGGAQNVQLVLRKANALDDFTARTQLAASVAVAVGNNVGTRLSLPYTFGANDASNGIELEVLFPNVGAVGGGGGVPIYVGDFELVRGNASVIPLSRDVSVEEQLCMAFFEKSYDRAVAPGTANSNGMFEYITVNAFNSQVKAANFKVPKFKAPAITIYSTQSGAAASAYNVGGAVDIGMNAEGIGESGFSAYVAAGSLNGALVRFQWAADSEFVY